MDSEGDRPIWYKELRLLMAKLYEEMNFSSSGPATPVSLPKDFDSLLTEEKFEAEKVVKESKELVKIMFLIARLLT